MLMGGMIYLLIQRDCPWAKPSPLSGMLGGAGLLLIISSYFTITGAMAFPGYIALFPTLGTALFLYSNSWGNNWSGPLLAWAPLQFIGKISYSLYLWHWPLIIFLKAHCYPEEIGMTDKLALFVVSFIVSILSWKYIEQPFRHPAKRNSAFKAIVPACILLVLMFGVSLVIRKYDGFPSRMTWMVGETVVRIKSEQEVMGWDGCPPIFNATDLFRRGGYQVGVNASNNPELIVIGDSHAVMYGTVLAELAVKFNVPIAFFTQSGLKPLFQGNTEEDMVIYRQLENWNPSAVVVILRSDRLIDKATVDANYRDRWVTSMRKISSICDNFYFVLQTPRSSGYDLNGYIDMVRYKLISDLVGETGGALPIRLIEPEDSRHSRSEIRTWVKELGLSNLRLLDPGLRLIKNGNVTITKDGRLLYMDDDHLSNLGAELASPIFSEIFEKRASEIESTNSSEEIAGEQLAEAGKELSY
jgi:hypothetical protein